jgi:phosphatidate cytidylyltransferase
MSVEHKKRVIAALIGVLLLFGIYFGFGHYGLVLITIFISLAAYLEFLSFSGALQRSRWVAISTGLALSAWLCLRLPGAQIALYVAGLALLLHGLWRAHEGSADQIQLAYRDLQAKVFGLLYLIVFPSFLVQIHLEAHGPKLLLLLLGIIWLGDIGAYYGGKSFGRHKLSPNVSPGKTIEGAISALCICALFAALYGRWALPHLSIFTVVTVAILSSAVAQAGDLIESLMKRAFSVKDSGALIPGHGGVFDRFDSLILAAPFFYFLLRLSS